jgi:3-hydroxybutyryl-CoA dehydrogenase
MSKAIETVVVLGAGTMGRGIAQNAAAVGCRVRLLDADMERARAGRDAIDARLAKLVAKERITRDEHDRVLARIEASDNRAEAVADADVVVEAAPEIMSLKRELFAALAKEAPKHALLGSNTSSLSISEMAAGCGAEERVIGLHFFNPVPVMKLLELVRGKSSSDETVERARAFAKLLGKDAILVKDSPGFATSRLGVLLGLEAMRMLQEGVASAADIDKAMELGYRHPMGPLKLTDLVGLDVRLAIAEHLHGELGSSAFEPPDILRQKVAAGELGRKSGKGFYDYEA